MSIKSIKEKVVSRIHSKGKGWVFTSSDFRDISGSSNICSVFKKLVKHDTIQCIYPGMYYYPKYSCLLKAYLSPDIRNVAYAFSRKFNWRIQLSGSSALNIMGVSTQVPARYVFCSDGPNRVYTTGKTTIEFRKISLKESGLKHFESCIIVRGLKELGEKHIDEKIICKIREWIPVEKRRTVLKDTQYVTAWIYKTICKICKEIT
jgi:hypothetical protein